MDMFTSQYLDPFVCEGERGGREREEGGREGEEKQLKGGRVLVRSVSSTTAPTKNTKVGKYATGTMRSVLSK